ncbi:unnamed protein product [Eruca vesicaria subsp. sativa]|uniref:Uncharacterized protein n=1 Tax=Eruca vesicaria subsp. sativa TaxID=29727 RepID=A0ABC8JQR0_ERUVS|nr:unnamed protein product [Eruca vesicaria subsp. sativa]
MNLPVPGNLTPEPEPNAKPVLQSEESSTATVEPPSPRNPNPPDLNTTEAVTEEFNAKNPLRENDLQEKNEQLSAEPVVEENDSDMIVVTTGWVMRYQKQPDEIAQDAVDLLLKHSVGHQEISKSEESGPSRKKNKNKTDYDSSWVPPQGQSGDGRTSLNDRFGY